MFERILIPLDGSETSEKILTRVRPLLRREGREAILLHAVSVLPLSEANVGLDAMMMEGEADAYLASIERNLAGEGVMVRRIVSVGAPAETILDAAERERVSLVALSTHGRTGLSRWAFGSVAEKVLRAAQVPVFLSRDSKESEPGGVTGFRTLLVPIDLSDLSLQIVPYAAELARTYDARVLILNVAEGPGSAYAPVHEMTQAYEQFKKAGVLPEPILKQGDPASEILDACREKGADLIAMTSHGRGGLSRWVLGSVAEKVLRHSTVPMLVMRTTGPAPSPQRATELWTGEHAGIA